MQIHSVLGILYYKKGNYTRALSEFRFVINKNPKDQEARLFVSRIYQRLGRIDSAKKELWKKLIFTAVCNAEALPRKF